MFILAQEDDWCPLSSSLEWLEVDKDLTVAEALRRPAIESLSGVTMQAWLHGSTDVVGVEGVCVGPLSILKYALNKNVCVLVV